MKRIDPFLVFLISFNLFTQEKIDYSNWFTFEPSEYFSESSIDLTWWLDAPAGKHGSLQMREENLVFGQNVMTKYNLLFKRV